MYRIRVWVMGEAKARDALLKLLFAFLFAVGLFSFQVFTAERVGTDDLVQIGTAVNFIEGHGFVQLNASNDGTIEAVKFFAWPYGLRIVHVPLLLLTSGDVETALLLSKVLGFIVLLGGIASVVLISGFTNWVTTLSWMFFFSPLVYAPVRYMGAVDLITLGISLFAISCLYRFFTRGGALLQLFLFSVAVALLPHFRYAYLPQALMLVLLFIVIALLRREKWRISMAFLIIPLLGIVTAVNNPYFLRGASRTIEGSVKTQGVEEACSIYVPRIYAVLANAIIPDFILLNWAKKLNPDMSVHFIAFLMLCLAIISSVLLLYLLIGYLDRGCNPMNYAADSKLLESILTAIIVCDMVFYAYLYWSAPYTCEQLTSEVFAYKSLAVVNRYFAPMQTIAVLLFMFYSYKKKYVVLRMAWLSMVLFGCFHFGYLRTVFHPTDREANMNLLNNPEGSYNDARRIGDLVRRMKTESLVYFGSYGRGAEESYRQVDPWVYAKANGAVMVHHDITTGWTGKTSADTILVLSGPIEKVNDFGSEWELIFEGKVYCLFVKRIAKSDENV